MSATFTALPIICRLPPPFAACVFCSTSIAPAIVIHHLPLLCLLSNVHRSYACCLIRSHAQKHFLKVQKSGSSEHVPPPRAKRKAIHPYPLKSLQNASMPLPVIMTFPSGSSYLSPGYTQWEDASSMIVNTTSNVSMSTWVNRTPVHVVEAASVEACNCSSSCTAGLNIELSTYETSCQRDQDLLHQSVPNFATVYRFIGGILDPDTNSDHIKKLKEMNPVDREIVVTLMSNLIINLWS